MAGGRGSEKKYDLLVLILYSNLAKNLYKAPLVYHAFTGFGFTTFLSRKGKIQLLNIR